MENKMEPYIVYVQTNENGYVTAVNSSEFLFDTEGWTAIDRGYGDQYHHAQGNYFPKPTMTDIGVWQYKLENGSPRECTAEEIAEQEAALPEPYDEMADMKEALNALGVTVDG